MKTKTRNYLLTIAGVLILSILSVLSVHATTIRDDYITQNNSILNNTGLFYGGSKANVRSSEIIICKGSNLLDDAYKFFTCDSLCLSTDTDCYAKLNIITANNNYILTKGTYYTSHPIQISDNVSIIGKSATIVANGSEAVWSSSPGGEWGVFMTRDWANGNHPVSNVVFDGLNFIVGGSANAFTLADFHNLYIKNCDFTGNTSASGGGIINWKALYASTNSDGLYFINNNVHDLMSASGNGLIFLNGASYNVSNVNIVDNKFKNIFGEVIQLSTSSSNYIFYTNILNNWFENIEATGSQYYNYATAVFMGVSNTNNNMQHTKIIGNTYINGNGYPTNKRATAFMVYGSLDTEIASNHVYLNSSFFNCASDANFLAIGRTTTPDVGLNIHDNYVEGFKEFWDPDSMIDADIHDNVVKNTICGGLTLGYGTFTSNINIHDNVFSNSVNEQTNSSIELKASQAVLNAYIHDNVIDWGTKNYTNNSLVYIYGNSNYFNFSSTSITNNKVIYNGTYQTIIQVLNQQCASCQIKPYIDNYVYSSALTAEVCNRNSAFNSKAIYNSTTQCTCLNNAWKCLVFT